MTLVMGEERFRGGRLRVDGMRCVREVKQDVVRICILPDRVSKHVMLFADLQ